VTPEVIVEKCRRHRGPGGTCRLCVLQAIEDLLLEEHPELCRAA